METTISYGHLVRHGDLQKLLIAAKTASKRGGRGLSRTSWTENLTTCSGLSYRVVVLAYNNQQQK